MYFRYAAARTQFERTFSPNRSGRSPLTSLHSCQQIFIWRIRVNIIQPRERDAYPYRAWNTIHDVHVVWCVHSCACHAWHSFASDSFCSSIGEEDRRKGYTISSTSQVSNGTPGIGDGVSWFARNRCCCTNGQLKRAVEQVYIHLRIIRCARSCEIRVSTIVKVWVSKR